MYRKIYTGLEEEGGTGGLGGVGDGSGGQGGFREG